MSGLNLLYKLLLKDVVKGSGQASGIMSIGGDIRKLADKKFQSYVMTAKAKGVDLDKLSEQEIKYMLQLNKPKPIKAISADSPEGKLFTQGMIDMLDKASGKNVIKTDFGGGITDIVTETITKIKSKKPIEAMAEANSVLARKGKYKNLTEEQSQKIIKDTEDHIFERDIKPDPEDFAHGGRTGSGLNYLLGEDDQNSRVPYGEGGTTQEDFNQFLKEREQRDKDEEKRKFKKDYEDWKKWQKTQGGTVDFAAEGGRIGFGLGGINSARRAFLKWLGVGAAGVGAAKSGLLGLLKGGGKKAVIKDLTSVPINNIEGMPAWFKPLVNQIIKKGDDVSTKFATGERKIVHVSELPDSKTRIFVEQDLTTGDVVVDIGMGKHGFKEGHLGQPVRLEYKAAEDIMSGPDGDELFKVGERDPHIKVKSRDEMTFDQKKYPDKKPEEFWVEEAEFTGGHPENVKFEETISEKFGEHGSNFDEVEKFATGKVKKAKTKETRFLGKKYLSEGDDMASGGRVPLALGRGTEQAIEDNKALEGRIDRQKRMTDMLNKKSEDAAHGRHMTPFKGLTFDGPIQHADSPPEPEFQLGPFVPKEENYVVFDDGTVYYKDTGEFYNTRGTQITGPSPSAKPVPKTMEAADGGRVPLGAGGDPGTSSAEEVREAWKDYLKEKEKGTFKGSWQEWQPIWIRANLAQGGRASLSSGGLAGMLGE